MVVERRNKEVLKFHKDGICSRDGYEQRYKARLQGQEDRPICVVHGWAGVGPWIGTAGYSGV